MSVAADFQLRAGHPRSGKSTLFDALSFLKDALTQNVAHAVERRGGFRELVSRGESGPISILIRFLQGRGSPAVYMLNVIEEKGRPVVDKELLSIVDKSRDPELLHLVTVSHGRGSAQLEREKLEWVEQTVDLKDPSALAIKGLGQFKEFRAAAELSEQLESWHISDFCVADARPSAETGFAERIRLAGPGKKTVH